MRIHAGGSRLWVRPLLWGEDGPVRTVFDGMSRDSRAMRFLVPMSTLPAPMLRLLVEVDHVRHGGWVVEHRGVPVAIGRWIRLRDEPTVADLALAVVDAHQGQGIGGFLVQLLAAAARDAGISTFCWETDVDNHRVARLAAGLEGTRRASGGVLTMRTALPDGEGVDVAAVRRLARRARALSAARQLELAA